jgi:hypothetical protein
MTEPRTTLEKQAQELEKKADRLEEHARQNGLLPADNDKDEGVGRVSGLVP